MPADRGGPAAPRFALIDRQQLVLRPVIVEALIPADHPARAIWAFVGQLDLSRYHADVRAVEGGAGRSATDPHLLVSLWVYSYSRGVSSGRGIARLCEDDPAYQWLTGLSLVCGHTLSDFRVAHAAALRDLFAQVLAVLTAEGLITLARVMQDGTKVRACAASKQFRRRPRVEILLAEAHAIIDALDRPDATETSARQRAAQVRAAHDRRRRLDAARQEFEKLAAAQSTVTRVSTTDPDARIMKQADGGSAPNYNVQIATDAAHGLIVDIDVTQAGNDKRQLMPALDRLQTGPGLPTQFVVDGGYISRANVVATAARGVELIGPAPAPTDATIRAQKSYAARDVAPAFQTEQFHFDVVTNAYRCPQGRTLPYDAQEERDGMHIVRYKAMAGDCDACPAKPACCPRTRTGRSIERREPLPAVAAFQQHMQTDDARAIYRTRSQIAEFPHLWIKAKFGLRQFRVRGQDRVRLEALWAALTYDIQQWIRLRWPPPAAGVGGA